jgi:hypothetical protein
VWRQVSAGEPPVTGPGDVDEHSDATEVVGEPVDDVTGLGCGCVEGLDEGPLTALLHGAGGLVRARAVVVRGQAHVEPLGREQVRDSPADAGVGTSDHGEAGVGLLHDVS